MINWMFNNLETLILVTVVLASCSYAVYSFATTPSKKRKKMILTWLLQAVIEAEKLFNSKSGKLKFSYVYDAYLKQFPILSRYLPMWLFEELVNEALVQMRNLIKSNEAIKEYVEGDK